jgi:hypothetical protein
MVCAVISVGTGLSSCSGESPSTSANQIHSDAGAQAAAQAPVPVPVALPLGKATLDDFGYRRGPGREDYDRAVKAEKLAREDADWQRVVDACRAALVADPGHLDASWLLAAALARLGQHAELVVPLSQAVAGDWAKWGERSLTLPLFGDFLASRWGAAWKSLAETYRGTFAEAGRRAVVVLGREDVQRHTEIYGWDPDSARWLRLSRTGGTVVALLPGPPGSGVVAYVAYRDLTRAGDRKGALKRPRVAVIELVSGRVSRELAFPDVEQLRLGWKTGKNADDPALIATIDGGKDAGTWTLDWKRGHKKAAPKGTTARDAIVVARGQVRRLRLPVAAITADWDDDGLASAIRLDDTRKTITPPAGLVVDGHALVWSPDRARLALVGTPDGDCEAAGTLFVADAGTGKLHKLGTAAAPAPVWVDATHLAYTAGNLVRIVDVTTAHVDRELTAAGGVATATVARPCAAASTEALFAAGPDEPADDEPVFADPPADADAGVTPSAAPVDAGP